MCTTHLARYTCTMRPSEPRDAPRTTVTSSSLRIGIERICNVSILSGRHKTGPRKERIGVRYTDEIMRAVKVSRELRIAEADTALILNVVLNMASLPAACVFIHAPCTSSRPHKVGACLFVIHTYAVLRAKLLAQRSRHDLSPDVTRGIKVGLTVDATQRADHDTLRRRSLTTARRRTQALWSDARYFACIISRD